MLEPNQLAHFRTFGFLRLTGLFAQDIADITSFIGFFVDGDAIADINRDDRLDLGDIVQFVGSYQLGCDPGGNGGD